MRDGKADCQTMLFKSRRSPFVRACFFYALCSHPPNMNSMYRWLVVAGLIVLSLAQQKSYTPCPILGPRYPRPNSLERWPTIQAALTNLTKDLDALVSSGGDSSFTAATPDTTTFSIALFSSNDVFNPSKPYFWEYHHIAQSFDDVEELDSRSMYNIA